MTNKLNAHKVLTGAPGRNGLLQKLDIGRDIEMRLSDARDEMRVAIRSSLASLNRQFTLNPLTGEGKRPRFRMQGSRAYKTLNQPAHLPPQEIDFDDGIYLPTSLAERRMMPRLAAASYFEAVETALQPLCKRHGWRLIEKESCVRVQIEDGAHVDMALYAIPDEDFSTLVEEAKSVRPDLERFDDRLFEEHVYQRIDPDRIMLAQRSGGWIASDPRKLEDWFKGAVNDHGSVLRRICRYLKAWRDHRWPTGGPSSIALMAACVRAFDEIGDTSDTRDDVVLLEVARKLPQVLREVIPNPVVDNQPLCKDWATEVRQEYVDAATSMMRDLEVALTETFNKEIAIRRLVAIFGDRVSGLERLLEVDTREDEVLSHPPATVSIPKVPRTTSA